MKPPNYPIESVDNALRLLLSLLERQSMTVSDASELLGVAPSTAHRLLAMLQYRGFVDQDKLTKRYRSGPVLLKLGLTAVRQMDLRQHARPVLERLSKEIAETVNLVVLQGLRGEPEAHPGELANRRAPASALHRGGEGAARGA
jgi:DNA-binding IclR family transcriptional regulator